MAEMIELSCVGLGSDTRTEDLVSRLFERLDIRVVRLFRIRFGEAP
jgi:hypothetical protein